MLHEQAPDDETTSALGRAREPVQAIRDNAEQEGEGQFTKARKASKEAREDTATASASRPGGAGDTPGEYQSTIAITATAPDEELGSETTETDDIEAPSV
ncbi:hypothetical protein RBB50_007977 [Rhinocladiella similis]